jgi:hypothetical protein
MKSIRHSLMRDLKIFPLAFLLIASTAHTEVVFFETFGTGSTGGGTIGYSSLGDNRSIITAGGFKVVAGTGTDSMNFALGIYNPGISYVSDRATSGVTGASGINALRFNPESAGYLDSRWYQFNSIPLIGHVGESLNIGFLFRPLDVSMPGLTTLNDLFTLSVSWDGENFNDVSLSFANGNSSQLTSWKTVTGTALAIESESIWLRITANPSTQNAFPEIFFDDLKLSTSGVPEPATVAFLAGLGAIGVAGFRRRRRIG